MNKVKTPLSLKKKLLFAVIVTAVVAVAFEGGLILCGVEPDYLGDDTYAGFVSHIPHFVPNTADDGETMTVAGSKTDVLNPISFAPIKPADTYRIVCVGGSTTYGRPFFDETSFAGWLRVFLSEADPSKNWEVINAGAVSYASYRIKGLMQELAAYEPDLYIIYTGHNEFLERRTYENLLSQPNWWRESLSLVSHTRTATVLRQTLDTVGIATRRPELATILSNDVNRIPLNAVGPDAYRRNEIFRRQVVEHFSHALEAMLTIAEESDAETMLIVPASNLADFAPFKSQHVSTITAEERTRWQELYQNALKLTQERRLTDALVKLQEAESIDGRRADLHFAKGQLLLGLKSYDKAAQAFRLAKQEDICPLRAIDEIVQQIRQIARARGTMLVDFDSLAAQHSDYKIPNRKLFHDHIHLTIQANQLLAQAILAELGESGLVNIPAAWPDRLPRVIERVESRIDGPRYADDLLRLASLLMKLNQHVMARQQAITAFELSGRSADKGIAVSKLLLRMGAPRDATQVMQNAVLADPESAAVRCQLGVALLAGGQANAALEQLESALKMDAELAEAHRYAGLLKAEAGRFGEAEAHFRQLASLNPKAAVAWENLALSLARQNRHAEARAHYDQALKLDPKSASAHRNLSLTLKALGQTREAEQHAETASRLTE